MAHHHVHKALRQDIGEIINADAIFAAITTAHSQREFPDTFRQVGHAKLCLAIGLGGRHGQDGKTINSAYAQVKVSRNWR